MAVAPDDVVHVWCAELDARRGEDLAPLLGAAELERAGRLHDPHVRAWFVAAHAARRLVLAHYTGLSPTQLRFVSGRHGKPRLAGRLGDEVRFNASRSSSLTLVAIAWRTAVGADVERVQPLPSLARLASEVMSADERAAFAALPAAARLPAFYRSWTSKEAFGKLGGDGLLGEPRSMPSVPPPMASWSLFHLEPRVGFIAAVAVGRAGARCVPEPHEILSTFS